MAEKKTGMLLTEDQKRRMQQRENQYRFVLKTDKRHEQLFAPFGISFPVYRTLAYLLLHPEGAAPSVIADDLLILRQSMTIIQDGLEKKQWAERIPDPKDRRRLYVRLLPEGELLAAAAVEEENAYGRRVREYMGEAELEEYHRLDNKMYEAKMKALNDVLSERS